MPWRKRPRSRRSDDPFQRLQASALHIRFQSMASLQLTVLGSGTSMGVPTLGCHCAVCESADPHDQRTRPSVLLSCNGRNVVIDTTPDFRFQAMRARIDRLDAVIYTHAHADHILGLDDVRPYNMKQRAVIPIYGAEDTLKILRRQFAYIFDDPTPGSTLPLIELHTIDGPFEVAGLRIIPIPAMHGTQPVLGFRVGNAAYLTDFSSVPESSKFLLQGLDDFILDALRYVPHPTHSNVEQSLALVKELKPKRAWFTHICHDLGHEEANRKLPDNVRLAYDGLQFEVAPAPFTVVHSPAEWASRFGEKRTPTAITIGNFDGVHLGHQQILKGVVERAQRDGLTSAVLTFYPHPARVLRPDGAPALLETLDQRLAAIEQLGVDAVLVARFDPEMANLSPQEFVQQFLVDTMRAKAVFIGANFRFGHRQAGDAALLADLGKRLGFAVETVPPVIEGGAVVSSSAIRTAVRDGRLDEARRMLGRPFSLSGEIKPGTGQGRKLVVPTLNLSTEQELLPGKGVYATEAVVEGKVYRAATNVGMRPTFNGNRITVESYLFDFNRELTGGTLEVRFWKRLRDEKKFSGPAELREQILRDIDVAKEFFTTQLKA
jgi:phosphoribosyl 1,2-cyclic phosphate phosphodiesterase